MNGWWRRGSDTKIDWNHFICALEKHFPGIVVSHLTYNNFLNKIDFIRKMMGQDSKEEEEALDPKEWFEKCISGEIEVKAKSAEKVNIEEMKNLQINSNSLANLMQAFGV